MAGRKLQQGKVGRVVADNVARLRELSHYNYTELSAELSKHGRDIPPLAVRRIEDGERRVDVDDLAALALALNTSPEVLLTPEASVTSPTTTSQQMARMGEDVRVVKAFDFLGKPFITRIFFGDEEFPYAIAPGSVTCSPGSSARHNLMTLTLMVGNVAVENRSDEEQALGATDG